MIDPDNILIPRKPVESSNIQSIGYNIDFNILEIEFKENRVYRYYDVPLEEYRSLMEADSHGSYFNREIKSEDK